MGRVNKSKGKPVKVKGFKTAGDMFTTVIPLTLTSADINRLKGGKKKIKKGWKDLENSGIDKPFINPISETKETKESLDFIARVDNVRKNGVSKDDIKTYKMISNKHINRILNNDGKKSW